MTSMGRYRVFALFAVLALGPATVSAEDYPSLRQRVEGGDLGVDFRSLRFAFAQTPAYRPGAARGQAARRAVQQALEKESWADAIAAARAWLADEYVNPFAHLGLARALEMTGETATARFHHRVAEALFDSICRGGEGRSADAPCPVISLDEEHFYLARHRFEVGGDYERTCARDRPCHVYEVHEPGTDMLHDIHFDISVPLARMQQGASP
ncbi:MAG: DUF4919 domain-containing protein [Gammaproteobacteria bacterium]